MSLRKMCKEAYDRDGHEAVFEFVYQADPMRSWHYCEECELITPTDDDRTCLVCWVTKTKSSLRDSYCMAGGI